MLESPLVSARCQRAQCSARLKTAPTEILLPLSI